jgi:hypothetical protein
MPSSSPWLQVPPKHRRLLSGLEIGSDELGLPGFVYCKQDRLAFRMSFVDQSIELSSYGRVVLNLDQSVPAFKLVSCRMDR